MREPLQTPEAMIFDLDGTLFQTETHIIPAYHAAFDQLRAEGLYFGETPPDERILSSLGMLLDKIWENVLPGSSLELHKRADELLLHHQMKTLREGVGELYPHVQSTLQELYQRGVRLFVASNGLEQYVKEVIRHKGLADYFEGLYSAGEYQTKTKVDLVRILLDKHNVQSAWMVGDRSSDVEAGKNNGLQVIGCSYAGFGKDQELDGSDHIISSIDELLALYK